MVNFAKPRTLFPYRLMKQIADTVLGLVDFVQLLVTFLKYWLISEGTRFPLGHMFRVSKPMEIKLVNRPVR